MRRGVLFLILIAALLVGMVSVSSKQEVKTQASAKSEEYQSVCGKSKAVFKNGEVFINNSDKVANYWEANLDGPFWNMDCSWIAYTTGTPSSGFNVYLIKVGNGQVIVVDLHDKLPEYDHIYTEFISWKNVDEAEISVYGGVNETNTTSDKKMFLFDTINQIIRPVI